MGEILVRPFCLRITWSQIWCKKGSLGHLRPAAKSALSVSAAGFLGHSTSVGCRDHALEQVGITLSQLESVGKQKMIEQR